MFHAPLQMPVLVKAQGTQKLPHKERPRAACETFHQSNATGESEVDLRTDGPPPPGQSAFCNLRNERFNLA